MHLLSVVTINYNNSEGLVKTIESVLGQTWKDFQYIIIDGGSNDNSVDVVKTNNGIDYWVSEKDSGIYNAMNKGIEAADGKYILFLNSGDFLKTSTVLEDCFPHFLEEFDFLLGNIEFKDGNGKLVVRKHPEKITFSYLVSKTISHPSTFIKREMFDKFGLYNEKLTIVSDWEFFFKAIGLNGSTYQSIDITITHFDVFGISSNQNTLSLYEREAVFKKYLPTIFSDEMDTFIFDKYRGVDKRFRFLNQIDKSPFFRKVTTIVLMLIAKMAILTTKKN